MSANDHGKGSTYSNWGCRCSPCTEANRKRVSEANARRREQQPPADAHGKYTTYSNWGCRCEPCRAAHSARMALRGRAGSPTQLDLKEAS